MNDIEFIHTQLDCTYLEVLGGVEALPKWFKDLPFNHEEMEATIIDNKLENLIGVLNWDIRSTEQTNTFNKLFDF